VIAGVVQLGAKVALIVCAAETAVNVYEVTVGSTGSTGGVSIELLPGSGYYFNMNYHNGTQQIGALTVNGNPWIQAVLFQTALVTIHYQHSSGGAIPGASIGYYSGGWYVLGTSDGSGNASIEMLPVPYYYNASITGLATTAVGPFTDAAAGTPTHTIIAPGVGAKTGDTNSSVTDSSGNVVTDQDKITVYPNPANDLVNVVIPLKYAEAEVTVTDLAGKVLQTMAVTGNRGMPILLNLGDIARGIYIVKVNAGETRFAQKLIVR